MENTYFERQVNFMNEVTKAKQIKTEMKLAPRPPLGVPPVNVVKHTSSATWLVPPSQRSNAGAAAALEDSPVSTAQVLNPFNDSTSHVTHRVSNRDLNMFGAQADSSVYGQPLTRNDTINQRSMNGSIESLQMPTTAVNADM